MTDHIGIHQKLVENAVSYLTWHDQAVAETGFRGVSQVWMEPPVWFLWLKGQSGAYMLRIAEAEAVTESSYCSYLLHYFPEKAENVTQEEADLLTSDKFDEKTCTPTFEHNADFHGHFITAEIGISAADSNSLSMAVVSRSGRFIAETEHFFDFFFGALNFYTKSHHISCMRDKKHDTVLLPYSKEGMMRFFSDFGLNSLDFEEVRSYRTKWCTMAHYNAVCSVIGTCSCSH